MTARLDKMLSAFDTIQKVTEHLLTDFVMAFLIERAYASTENTVFFLLFRGIICKTFEKKRI